MAIYHLSNYQDNISKSIPHVLNLNNDAILNSIYIA